MEILDLIKKKIRLSGLVSKYTKLKKAGDEWTGLCPFHHEKSPSFSVNDDKGVFFCFGCRAAGNIIDFVAQKERLSNREAFNWLADKAGLIVTFSNKDSQRLYQVWQFFSAIAKEKLTGTSYDNLCQRINSTTIDLFNLGYIPSANEVINKLEKEGWHNDELIKAGILLENNKTYFNRRLIIPIIDDLDRIVAIAARSEDGKPPKYINSPETKIFQKKQILFNYYQAKSGSGPVILVEGYFDVMVLHEKGFTRTVASMGTGLSLKQINLLWSLANEVMVMMDGDNAGQNAALRIAFLALEHARPGKTLFLLTLPQDFDPEEYIKKYNSLEEILAQKSEVLDFILFKNNFSSAGPEIQAKIMADIKDSVNKIGDPNLKNLYLNKLSDLVQKPLTNKKDKPLPIRNDVQILRCKILLAILWEYPEIFDQNKEILAQLNLGKLDVFKNFLLENDAIQQIQSDPEQLKIWDPYLKNVLDPRVKTHYKILQTNPVLAQDLFEEIANLVLKKNP